jgi:hypothetical protein
MEQPLKTQAADMVAVSAATAIALNTFFIKPPRKPLRHFL